MPQSPPPSNPHFSRSKLNFYPKVYALLIINLFQKVTKFCQYILSITAKSQHICVLPVMSRCARRLSQWIRCEYQPIRVEYLCTFHHIKITFIVHNILNGQCHYYVLVLLTDNPFSPIRPPPFPAHLTRSSTPGLPATGALRGHTGLTYTTYVQILKNVIKTFKTNCFIRLQ